MQILLVSSKENFWFRHFFIALHKYNHYIYL